MNQNIDQIEAIRRYLSILEKDGLALEHIPEGLRCGTLYCTAVKENGRALQFVPIHLRSFELCLSAFNQTKAAFLWIPQKHRKEITANDLRWECAKIRHGNSYISPLLLFIVGTVVTTCIVIGSWWCYLIAVCVTILCWWRYRFQREIIQQKTDKLISTFEELAHQDACDAPPMQRIIP